MMGKNVTKKFPARKSSAHKSSHTKTSRAKTSHAKTSRAKTSRAEKLYPQSAALSLPAPPFSRFEGLVISCVLVCIIVSYALAYFLPIQPFAVQYSLNDQLNDQNVQKHQQSQATTPQYANNHKTQNRDAQNRDGRVAQSETIHGSEPGFGSLGPEATLNITKGQPTKTRLRPIAREKKDQFSDQKPPASDSGLAEGPARRPATALIGDGYNLVALRAGNNDVPRRFLEHFPAALTEIEPASRRKDEFFKIMLPLILKVNETISDDRDRLLAFQDQTAQKPIFQKYDPPTASEKKWVYDLASRYGFKDSQENLDIEALLKRVDTIPVSLALAQAAIESAWGSSRFAQEGNAPFGQWSFNPEGGLKPLDRDANKTHFVRRFSRLIDAVRSYAHNLNTHAAYRELRGKRARLRDQKEHFSGLDLVDGLKRYSQRGQSYVQDVRRLIKANDLAAYDSVKLAPKRLARAKNDRWVIATE